MLEQQQRAVASSLYQGLCAVKLGVQQGRSDYLLLQQEAMEFIQQRGLLAEYVSIRRSYDLELPLEADKQLVILAAARLGEVRLIDNIPLNL